jgi:polyhydroxyalkanoate synthesis regulator phasin
MNLKKVGLTVAAVLVSGALLTGAAFAAGVPSKMADKLQQEVQAGKLSQGQADVITQLFGLRQSAMEKLKADEKALIDQAVKDGKLTQDQADKLQKREGHFGQGPMQGKTQGKTQGRMHGKQGPMFFFGKNLSADQLKAKLDAAVKSGKLTQEKADQALKQFEARQQQWQQKQQNQSGQNG